MKLVLLSDTHNKHRQIKVPDGDVLIHAGDMCYSLGVNGVTARLRLGRDQIADFNAWLGMLPHKHKIVIAGNHDFLFEKKPDEARKLLTNATYLQDSAVVIDGVKFWGSPWQPWFGGWAFNAYRGDEIRTHWDEIPLDTDVLITHGPPKYVRDRSQGEFCGSMALNRAVYELEPKLHVFGHIHEGYGTIELDDTQFVNCSLLDGYYQPVNLPIICELDLPAV